MHNPWNFILTALILTGLIIWILILTAQTTTIIDELNNLAFPIPTPFTTTTNDNKDGQKGQKGQKGSCDCGTSSCRKVCCYQQNSHKGCKAQQSPPSAPTPPIKGQKGMKGETGQEGPTGPTGPKGSKGDPDGQKGEKGEKGNDGAKGDAGGQKGEKGEKGEGGEKGDEGSVGQKGNDGQKGQKGELNLDNLRMFNWGHSNDEGTLNSDQWDGAQTVSGNKQTHHIFDLGSGTYTVTAVMMVDMNQPDQHLYVDEISPANFNSSSITNPMDIKFISVTGENKVTVAQGTGGDADQKITFTSSTDDEVIKVVFEVTATEPLCSFWYYRSSSNNNKLHLYQVIIETS